MSKKLVMMRGEPCSLGLHWTTARQVRAHIQAAPKGAGTPIGGLHRRRIPFHATPPYGGGSTAGNVTQTRPTRSRRGTGPGDRCSRIGTIAVLEGKGAKRRVVGIDRAALSYIQGWLELRAQRGLSDDCPLFCTVSNDLGGAGRPMHSSAVREMLKLYARKAGVAKRVHPHGLRHTHAYYELSIEGNRMYA
jgi:hypothetical protein